MRILVGAFLSWYCAEADSGVVWRCECAICSGEASFKDREEFFFSHPLCGWKLGQESAASGVGVCWCFAVGEYVCYYDCCVVSCDAL